MAELRRTLGPDALIMIDLHWKFTAEQALELIGALERYRPFFVEAPVKPEDHAGPLLLLASHASRYQTGQEMRVDGGFTA